MCRLTLWLLGWIFSYERLNGFLSTYALLLHHVNPAPSSHGASLFKSPGLVWISKHWYVYPLAQYFLNQLGGPASQDIAIDK